MSLYSQGLYPVRAQIMKPLKLDFKSKRMGPSWRHKRTHTHTHTRHSWARFLTFEKVAGCVHSVYIRALGIFCSSRARRIFEAKIDKCTDGQVWPRCKEQRRASQKFVSTRIFLGCFTVLSYTSA